ncbi:aspartic peptidase A1 [Suillus decipiens]|nr:aspartic peptidase A1 [Suillus decipiens]
MFSVVSLLALLACSVTGSPAEVRNPPVTLPMTRKLAFSNITDLLRHDEARLAAFTEYSTHDRRVNVHVPLTSAQLSETYQWGYTVAVGIGFPFITYNLIVDTASAITWCGTGTLYLSGSGVNTEVPVAFNYHYGSFAGTIWEDKIIFTEEITIDGMKIGVASTAQGILADGVLGIGPTALGLGALPNSPQEMIPTVTDYLVDQGIIIRPVVGILFQPIVANAVIHGQLTFGGSDPAMYISYHPDFTEMTTTAPSSRYWGINQRITYANTEILAYTAGIVDSTCTFLYLAIDAYERYKDATGGIVNQANGLLQISPNQYHNLPSLEFHIGRRTYRFIANAQIWPRSLNHKINGGDNDIFLVVKSLATPTGAGFDFINGYVFLQRFYTVFDSGKRRVGFAETAFTYADSN